MKTIDIGSRLELMVDDFLIDKMNGTVLKLHTPQKMPLSKLPLTKGYSTVIKDGSLYRAWYRDVQTEMEGPPEYDGDPREIFCYAESRDGIDWSKPGLGIHSIGGTTNNNVFLNEPPFCHNFSPMLDERPGVPPGQRYKALAGLHHTEFEILSGMWPDYPTYREPGGLWAFASADGIHWSRLGKEPVITSDSFAFDSQNVSFWSEHEGCYVAYYRTWESRHGWFRTVSRCTSDDYIHWSDSVILDPNDPGENIYTSQTHPYFRAPHIYIATPTRFAGDERGGTTEIIFMSARGDGPFTRTFREAWIRPGLDPANWNDRVNYLALNIVPTSSEEISMYHMGGHRYVLRTDGFASVSAGYQTGEFITKPLRFNGTNLVINFSTAASGFMRVELQTAEGIPLPGFTLDDCPAFWGDAIDHTVVWSGGADLSQIGQPVRLRSVMRDADLFALRFL